MTTFEACSRSCACEASEEEILRRRNNKNTPKRPPPEAEPGAPTPFSDGARARGAAPAEPRPRGFPTFFSAASQPVLGVPVRESVLLHVPTQERCDPVNFSLYVNGFAFTDVHGMEVSISLSPFALVRNCRFQTGACTRLKSFKVALLDHNPVCYFAVQSESEREAEEERSEWVLGLSHTILLITDSILPAFPLTCDPLPHIPWTSRRLLAGYLIHRDDACSVSVLFCELRAHDGKAACLTLYENDTCETAIVDIAVTDESACCEIVGINCSCFVVDCHHFASRTPSERKLWFRAVSNVKVKIQNRAPPPSEDEMQHYRDAIREHIQALELSQDPGIQTKGALLTKGPWKCAQQRPPNEHREPEAPQAAADAEARKFGKRVEL